MWKILYPLVGSQERKSLDRLIGDIERTLKEWKVIEGSVGSVGSVGSMTSCNICWIPFEPSINKAFPKYKELGEKHNWEINVNNAAEITKELEEILSFAADNLPVKDNRISVEEYEKRQQQAEERKKQQELAKDSWKKIMEKRPIWAKAAIVAEYDVDKTDLQTDYFAHNTARRVVIGWRNCDKESFKQLRAAAGKFPETKHLGLNAPDSIEHRDNYSMGSGNYLKDGYTHSTGWKVRSYKVLPDYYLWEDAIPEDIAPSAPNITKVTDITITKNEEKNGIEIRFPAKPEAEILIRLKQMGWRWSKYSNCWYIKYTPTMWEAINSTFGTDNAETQVENGS